MWVSEEQGTSQAESVHPSSTMLLKAWERMRGARSAPLRQDFDLAQLRKLMPALFIAEQCASSRDFRWRLAGTTITALMEGDVTGRAVAEGWDGEAASAIRRLLAEISATHRPARLRLSFTTDRGQSFTAEMLGVPLMAADGQATQVLGGLFTFPDPSLTHYETITARGLAEAAPAADAARRFRVITGGRG